MKRKRQHYRTGAREAQAADRALQSQNNQPIPDKKPVGRTDLNGFKPKDFWK